MNSLVVFLSVMALAAAKPGFLQPGIISYTAPAVAVAPAAVSHQSRIDIKSSPAIVATEAVAPVTRTVIAQPAIVAAPAAYAAPVAYSAPAAYIAHSAYTSPIAVSAPAEISRVDLKSSPAVINTFAAPVLNPFAAAPIAYSSQIAAAYTPTIFTGAIAPAVPETKKAEPEAAESIDASDLPVAPTETPEVAAARAAHLEAKALEEHKIQKRSIAVVGTAPVVSPYSATPLISGYSAPVVYPASVARVGTPFISTPILTSNYGIHHF